MTSEAMALTIIRARCESAAATGQRWTEHVAQ
jgi:hypothetical protein